MSIFLAILTALGLARHDEADALRQTAPSYLTSETAAHHLAAATFAGDALGVDPAVLLAVAWHESRYVVDARTREPGGRWSCGVMTPVPHREPCSPFELTATGGYLIGANHLRWWIDRCGGSVTCGLRAYVGGRGLARACVLHGRWYVRPGVDACDVWTMFLDRAARIRAALREARSDT